MLFIANRFLGFIISGSVKSFLKMAFDSIDIFLSPGGAIAGILDFAYDGLINNIVFIF